MNPNLINTSSSFNTIPVANSISFLKFSRLFLINSNFSAVVNVFNLSSTIGANEGAGVFLIS